MNRAEKRRQNRTKSAQKVATYNLTMQQIEQIKADAVHEATMNATKLVVSIPAMVLHEQFGFGQVRLERFASHFSKKLDSFSKGEFTVEDAQKYVEEHCSVRFK